MLRDSSQHPSPALVREAGDAYTRQEVCRLLNIENRQLKSWERQQLIPELISYNFSDLLSLKRLIRLREQKAHPRVIRQAIQSLRTYLKESPDHGGDVQIYKEGRRVCLKIGKQRLEPASGQMLFDFEEGELNKLLQLSPSQRNSAAVAEKLRRKLEADRWFEHGLVLEQTGAPFEEIIDAYRKATELDPHSAGALVNLGTIFFNAHAWPEAEEQYKRALEIDPDYALAHFNLGNLYDEQGNIAGALRHYNAALRVQPNYADAHYNIALLYQGTRDLMSAVRHWRAYLKLDGASTWAEIARRELRKLEALTIVPGNRPAPSKLQLLKTEKA